MWKKIFRPLLTAVVVLGVVFAGCDNPTTTEYVTKYVDVPTEPGPWVADTVNGAYYETIDIMFTVAEGTLDPGVNPYDINFWGNFHGAGGDLHVPGFYDGNGKWILRFTPTSPGEWNYVTESERIEALNGQTGSFSAVRAAGNKGRIIINPNNTHKLAWENGDSYFLMGFESDWLPMIDLDTTINTGDTGYGGIPHAVSLIDQIAVNGFNHVFMTVYSDQTKWGSTASWSAKYNFNSPSDKAESLGMWPFGGGTNNTSSRGTTPENYETLNPAFFRHLDKVISYLNSKGIIAHLMCYVWNKGVNWPEPGGAADNRYFDYVVARYQAYPNIYWDVSKEALDYGGTTQEIIHNKVIRLKELNAWKTLVTIHDGDYNTLWPNDPEVWSIQDWNGDLRGDMYYKYLRFSNKPIHNIEHGYYEKNPGNQSVFFNQYTGDRCLYRNYLCAFAGTYSTYYWVNSSWSFVNY
jgi:hypothetical protein